MLNKLLVVALSVVALCGSVQAQETEISLLGGGWSSHTLLMSGDGQYKDREDHYKMKDYNASHNMIGIEYNQIVLATFSNSYFKRSTVLAYNWHMAKFETEKIDFKLNLATGIVTGYDTFELIGGVSPYLLVNFETEYKISKKWSVSTVIGGLPQSGGVVVTGNLKLNYKF